MNSLPWITILGSLVRRFANNFHGRRMPWITTLGSPLRRFANNFREWLIPWITFFGSLVRKFAYNFHEWWSHEWKLLANRFPGDQKSLFTVTIVLLYFLHASLCAEHPITLKTIIDRWFHNCRSGWTFWFRIVTSPCLIYDVTRTWGTGIVTYCGIYIDCSCMSKLAQSRFSQVNNNRE